MMKTIAEVPENISICSEPTASSDVFSSGLRLRTNDASLEQIAEALERSVPIRNNRYHLKVYKNTFIGSECVDYLVRTKYAASRADAVHLGRKINAHFHLFQHVTLEHELKDDFFFYRFVEPERRTSKNPPIKFQANDALIKIAERLRPCIRVQDRMYRMKKYLQCFVASEVVTAMLGEGLAKTRPEAVELGRRLQVELNFWQHVHKDHTFSDDLLFFRFTDSPSCLKSEPVAKDVSTTTLSVSMEELSIKHLSNIADQLRRGLRVKDRRYKFKTYNRCFVASEAVDYMLSQNLARSRDEAVDLGRRLERELHLWYHVCNDHEFRDDLLFFRFASNAADSSVSDSLDDHAHHESTISSSNRSSDTGPLSSSSQGLSNVASKLLRGVQVKTRTYQFKEYKTCFVGSEAVDFMVQARVAKSREEAVELGQKLLENEVLYHVKQHYPFRDAYLFYRFSIEKVDEISFSERTTDDGDSISEMASETSEAPSVDLLGLNSLSIIGEQLRRGVRIKNRSYRLKTYKSCFVGSEAVDFLVQSGITESRQIAVEIGKRLSSELNVFHHVTYDHSFEDDYLFYRFTAADRKFNVAKTASYANTASTDTLSHLSSRLSLHSSLGDRIGSPNNNTKRLSFEIENSSLRKLEFAKLKRFQKGMGNHDGPQIVLIGGPSGSGKSTVVKQAFQQDSSCIFGMAKFDCQSQPSRQQRHSLAPFTALRELFCDLTRRLSQQSEILKEFRTRLTEEFAEAELQQSALIAWIPEIQSLFLKNQSHDDAVLSKRRSDSMNVIQLALQAFLKALASVAPVVLFLDDIMWSDVDTFDMLDFLQNRNLHNVLFCATYRTNMDDSSSNNNNLLMEWRFRIAEDVDVKTILLEDLTMSEIESFLSTCLKREPEDLEGLAELMKDRTHGNIFFLIQTLESLQNLSLLTFDYTKFQWTFFLKDIRIQTLVTDNVGELLATRIEQLPRCLQQVLKLASCFGSRFDRTILDITKKVLFVFDDLDYLLQEACDEEFVIRVSDHEYIFAHDQVQAVAYNLLPTGDERKRIHWDIANELSKKKSMLKSRSKFTCADQLRLSEEAMFRFMKPEDIARVAKIFLRAGIRASDVAAFGPASRYLEKGIKTLGESTSDVFIEHYDLAVSLFTTLASAELSAGRMSESRRAAESVVEFSKTTTDKRPAYRTIFQCLAADNKLDEQVELGLKLLAELGSKIPKNPNFVQVTFEYERAKMALTGYSDDEILALPLMSDKDIEFCIGILCDLAFAGYHLGRMTFLCFVVAKLVQLTMSHGLCKYTAFIFVLLGQDYIASFNDLNAGHRFVKIGLRCEQVVEAEDKARLLSQSCISLGCIEPISKSMNLGLGAYKAGFAAGEISDAFRGAFAYTWSCYFSGLPFEPLLSDVEKFALQMLEYKQHSSFFLIIPLFQLLLCLSGREEDPSDIQSGKAIEMLSLVPGGESAILGKESLMSYGMQLSVYMGDFERATKYYEQLKDANMGIMKASCIYHARLFFFSLICLENFRTHRRSRFKNEAKKHIDIIRELVESGAINLVHKLQLLDAEFSSVTSKDTDEVIRKYEKAIVSGSRSGFLQDGALSNFLCAMFCLRNPGKVSAADSYIERAYELYKTWGARAVAKSVKERHPDFFPEAEPVDLNRGDSLFRSRAQFRESFALMHKSLSVALINVKK